MCLGFRRGVVVLLGEFIVKFLFLGLGLYSGAWAGEQPVVRVETRLEVAPDFWVDVWTQGEVEWTASAREELLQSLKKIRSSWAFKKLWPRMSGSRRVAIWIDDQNREVSGYWSPDLKLGGVEGVRISYDSFLDSTARLKLLAHEFFHLMHHRFRPNEESWVREGLALYAEYQITGWLNRAWEEALEHPETSLVGSLIAHSKKRSVQERRDQVRYYGHLLQYFYYIHELCGGRALFLKLATGAGTEQSAVGVEHLDRVLRAQGSSRSVCLGFEASFEAFEIARWMNDPSDPEKRVRLTSRATTVRQKPPVLPLPSYSASAYPVDSAGACQKGDQVLSGTVCLRVRSRDRMSR